MKPALLLLCCLCFFIQAFAQAPAYTPVVHEGEVPDFIRKPLSQRIEEVTSYKKPKGVKKSDWIKGWQNEIILANHVDRYAKSGVLLFNDPMTIYVNKVVDRLLKNDPKVRGKIHVYVMQDPVVNAFATDHGLLAINTGLLAKVENEAELAFVLAHEIAHFKKQHVHQRFEDKEGPSYKAEYDPKLMREYLVKKHGFSKKLETEADDVGYEMFIASGYAPIAAASLFDRLKYGNVPYANIPFHKSLLEPAELSTPDTYTLSKTRSIDSYDFYNSDLSTHPDVRVRKEKMIANAMNAPAEQHTNFFMATTEAEFAEMQRIARYEQCRYHLRVANYDEAIYTAYISTLNYGEDVYFQKVIAYGLYALSKYATNDTIRIVLPNYKKVVGERQALNFYLQKLSKAELAALATFYNWQLHKKLAPQDTSTLVYLRSLSKDLVFDYEVTPKDLSGGLAAPFDKLEAFKDDKAFVAMLQNSIDYYKGMSATEYKQLNAKEKRNYWKAIREKNLQQDVAELAKKRNLIVVNPSVTYKDTRGTRFKENHTNADIAQGNLHNALATLGKAKGFQTSMYDVSRISDDGVNQFREIATINGHLTELVYHGNMGVLSSRYPELKTIMDAQNTKFALFVEGQAYVRKRYGTIIFYINLYTFPVFFRKVFTPHVNVKVNMAVINLESGQIVFRRRFDNIRAGVKYAKERAWKNRTKNFFSQFDKFLVKESRKRL